MKKRTGLEICEEIIQLRKEQVDATRLVDLIEENMGKGEAYNIAILLEGRAEKKLNAAQEKEYDEE